MLLENNPYSQDVRVRLEARALADAGYRVSVVCPKRDAGDRAVADVDGIRLYQFRPAANRGGFAGYVWEFGYSTLTMFLLSLLAWVRGGFDVVHAHNPPDTLFVIGAFYKLFGKRFVFDHHDVSPEMYEARYGAGARASVRRVLGLLERLTFRTADHVIATNESHRAIAIGRGRVRPDAVTIVRNGPESKKMKPGEPDPDLRAMAGTILAYVGIMGPQDGVDYLIRAVHHLVADLGRDDLLCMVIGRGDAVPGLEQLARSLGIEDHLWFTGWMSLEDLPRHLAAADICVDPDPSNPYNDLCTMIKMMEYMAMAKPIVAFDLPEHRISAGEAAAYAPGNDAEALARLIDTLMDDPDRRADMGRIGRERVLSELSWEHQKDALVGAYETIVGGSTRR